ncbi:MAG: DUF2726 domain-containing protein [Clostridiales bacterium]|nr:DUF2726 domain-containing protein [Clostridiales bacterium]MDE6618712.1 DUF2726 domain-containing protein [Clostridiales bacterium]
MKFRKGVYIIFFFVGLTLFAFSLMPFFRNFHEDTFWIMTLVSVGLMILCLVAIFHKPKEKIKLNSKYERKGVMITRPEYNFLQLLREIKPEKYEVIPQVALNSVIEKKTNTSYRSELFRVCDYCFVDKDTFAPLLLVELNDRSHLRADRQDRDAKVAAICSAAKIPLVTFWQDGDLSFKTVQKTVLKAILK